MRGHVIIILFLKGAVNKEFLSGGISVITSINLRNDTRKLLEEATRRERCSRSYLIDRIIYQHLTQEVRTDGRRLRLLEKREKPPVTAA